MSGALRLRVPVWFAAWLWVWVWLAAPLGALAQPADQVQGVASASALALQAHTRRVDAWPHVRLHSGPDEQAREDQSRGARDRFAPVSGHATLGLRPDAAWLHLPLQVAPGAEGQWVLDIDYPPLNRVNVQITQDGWLLQEAVLGNLLAPADRPMGSRTLSLPITLFAAGDYDVWLQVQTSGAMVLPITLNRPAAFHQHALAEQMLQGLLTGLALCLLVYSLAQWLTLRDSLFLKYALLVSGSLWFSLYFFGLGALYLWPGVAFIELRSAGLSSLTATLGSFLFIEHALRGPGVSRAWRWAMWAGAALCVLIALAFLLDRLAAPVVAKLMSLLSLVPALMGLPGAYRRARAGDAIGLCFLAAWAVYLLATVVVVGLIQGWMPVNFWTQHAFQFGATIDMLLFMRVLGLRTHALKLAVRHATSELDAMQSLAQTDPLTGLPNRRGLNEALTNHLPGCRAGRLIAVYVLDLDGFKPINDTHGHDVGDELLVEVAKRLRTHVRTSDVVARVGGDEFVIMAVGLSDEGAARELGQKLVDAFVAPFDVAGVRASVGLTAGYAIAPTDGLEMAPLLKRADAAMYAGKQAGKQRLVRASAGPVATA